MTDQHTTLVTAPLQPIDFDLARRADLLGRDQTLIPIGYWRSHADPAHPSASGPDGESWARAVETLDSERAGRRTNRVLFDFDYSRASASSRVEYFEWEAAQRKIAADAHAALPWPGDHVDPGMDDEERQRVAALLDRGRDVGGYCGSSWDRLDPARSINGSRELSAGGYIWPSGLSQYVLRYGLVIEPAVLAAIETDLGETSAVDPAVNR